MLEKRSLPLYVECLRTGLAKRKLKNPLYSLRSYARFLDIDPSSLSRLFKGKQDLSLQQAVKVVQKMGLPDAERDCFLASVAEERRMRAMEYFEKTVGSPLNVAGAERLNPAAALIHDLKNPLTAILSSLDALSAYPFTGDGKEMIQQVHQSLQVAANRMKRMMEEILSPQKPEPRFAVLEKRFQNIDALVQDVLAVMAPVAAAKNIEISFERPHANALVFCDPDQVLRVFSNLIENAVKFSPENSKIVIRSQMNGEEIVFAVRDAGPGISSEHLTHVFDRFWQVSKTNPWDVGLGLTIAREIVHSHQGKIWVESAQGSGSTFFFTLPAAAGASAEGLLEGGAAA